VTKTLTFLAATRAGTLYNRGDVAGFDDDVANRLVAQGLAREGVHEDLQPKSREPDPVTTLAGAIAVVDPGNTPVVPALVAKPAGAEVDPDTGAVTTATATPTADAATAATEGEPSFTPARPARNRG
jgi:hypothetical protein